MTITFECPSCHSPQRADLAAGRNDCKCTVCSHETRLRAGAGQGGTVKECAICGTQDLYVQKDFPHRLGLSIVGVGIVLSSIAWWYYWYPTALGILLLTALLDLCLYYVIGDVLVCYRCLAQYRGVERNPENKPFDLAIGERHRQERLRLELLRRSEGQQASGHTSTAVAAEGRGP